MDVTESDHKPVRCKFSVHLARVDRSVRRKEFGEVMKTSKEIESLLQELSVIPDTAVSTDSISLQNQETSFLQITNKSKNKEAVFHIICEGQCTINVNGEPTDLQPRASFGFPTWLEVMFYTVYRRQSLINHHFLLYFQLELVYQYSSHVLIG